MEATRHSYSLPSCDARAAYATLTRMLSYRPHPKQEALHLCPVRHRIVDWGRQTGKSHAAAVEALLAAIGTDDRPNPRVWIVAPKYDQAREIWNHIRAYVATTPLGEWKESLTNNPMRLVLTGAGSIDCKSADDPDGLRGTPLDAVVLEEAALIDEYTIQNVILPSFTVTRGRLLAISTPKGRNWFYQWYLRGQDPLEPNVASFHATSYDNPHADMEYIDWAKANMTEPAFRQEFLAEFVDTDAAVFRNVRQCATGEFRDPVPGKQYVIGVDWAKVHDYTVFLVGDVLSRSVVAFDRMQGIDYNLQVARLAALAEKYNHAKVLMDSTGVGDPILEMCKRADIRVEGYQYTWKSKTQAIEALAIAIEREELRYPAIDVLLNELNSYEQHKSESGNVKMGAPEGEGYYDDCVNALALLWWALRKQAANSGETVVQNRFGGAPQRQPTLVGSIFGG